MLQTLTFRCLSQAYWIDFGFSFIEGPASWRTPIAIQLIFAIAVVFIVWGLPESPRWLAKRGRMDEALEVICAVNDLPVDDPYVISEMESIRQVLALEQNEQAKSWTSVFKKDILQTRKRVGLAWFGLFMNQLSGINLGKFQEPTVPMQLSRDKRRRWPLTSATSRLLSAHRLGRVCRFASHDHAVDCRLHPAVSQLNFDPTRSIDVILTISPQDVPHR
jgi:MFS family permease